MTEKTIVKASKINSRPKKLVYNLVTYVTFVALYFTRTFLHLFET